MRKIWFYISSLGIKYSKDKLLAKSIKMANRINFILGLLSLTLFGVTTIITISNDQSINFYTSRLLILAGFNILALFLSYSGKIKLMQVITSLGPVMVIIIIPILLRYVQTSSFFYYHVVVIGFSLIPQVVFVPNQNRFWYYSSLFIFLILMFILDDLMVFFVVSEKSMMEMLSYFRIYYKMIPLVIFIFLHLALILFRNINVEYEEILKISNKTLKDKIDELTSTQKQLIESERMASLGRLLSGISHEMNSPLSAIKSNIEVVNQLKKKALLEVVELSHAFDDLQFTIFQRVMARAITEKHDLGTIELRALTKKLTLSLDEININQPRTIADILCDIGIFELNDDVRFILKHDKHYEILISIKLIKEAFSGLDNCSLGIKRVSNLMNALKAYTHNDVKNIPEKVDLGKNIDLALTLYKHELKKGIELVKNYEHNIIYEGFPDYLTHVWGNLISNAIHAMDYKGRLTISIKKFNNEIITDFNDSGRGIKPEDRSKIFEEFYTTKPFGKGTGLGLSISRRFIEKHHGKITVESEPGNTTFSVILPV
ncbi:MAG TPA: sensor histidine kinase [Cyclobacteriaceae bacterium]